MPEQLELPFGQSPSVGDQEKFMQGSPLPLVGEVTIKRHSHGFAVIVPNSVEILVFPHLGTALAEAKRLLHE